MQKWIGLVVFGLVAVLVESSLLPWPWVLIYVFLVTEADIKGEIFWLMLLGVLLDILTVRTVGVSSLALLAFFGVLMFLRRSFSGNLRVEGLWLLIASLVWNALLGAGGGYLILGLVIIGIVVFNKQMGIKEIKLR